MKHPQKIKYITSADLLNRKLKLILTLFAACFKNSELLQICLCLFLVCSQFLPALWWWGRGCRFTGQWWYTTL